MHIHNDTCAIELMANREATAHTIFVVHLFDLKQIFSFLDNIVVQLVPTCYCGKFGARESCYGREEEAMNDQAKSIERCYANNGDGSTLAGAFGQVGFHLMRAWEERSRTTLESNVGAALIKARGKEICRGTTEVQGQTRR